MTTRLFLLILSLSVFILTASAQTNSSKPRARDLGIPFDGVPAALNAITDVAGVEVGQVTLISEEGKLVLGKGPTRTGVNGNTVYAIPHDRLKEVLRKYNRLK